MGKEKKRHAKNECLYAINWIFPDNKMHDILKNKNYKIQKKKIRESMS